MRNGQQAMTDTYTPTQERFERDTANGSMEILLENGMYRHLRFRFKNGSFGWFDIVTWPGRLVITGDCETFTFSRLEDMFEFFRTGGYRVNPSYWQEKIRDGRDRARSFDWDRFRAEALAEFDRATEHKEDAELRQSAREDLEGALDSANADEWGAVQLLRDYHYKQDIYDTSTYFEFDLPESPPDGMDWDYHYIWCCRAIAWAIQKYDAHHAAQQPTTETAHA